MMNNQHKHLPVAGEPKLADAMPTDVAVLEQLARLQSNPDFGASEQIQSILQSREKIEDTQLQLAEVGRKYRTRFVLDGAIRQQGTKIRITTKLVDTMNGATIWANRYERPSDLADMFEIQDEIAANVAVAVAGDMGIITLTLERESRHKPPGELAAYEAVFKMIHFNYVFTEEAQVQAIEALENAIQIARDYALAKAMLSSIYADDFMLAFGLIENNLNKAEKLAEEAATLSPHQQEVRWARGYIYFLRKERERALAEI